MQLDPNQIRVSIENVEYGYYNEVSFSVIIQMLDLDTNRFVVVKTTEEMV